MKFCGPALYNVRSTALYTCFFNFTAISFNKQQSYNKTSVFLCTIFHNKRPLIRYKLHIYTVLQKKSWCKCRGRTLKNVSDENLGFYNLTLIDNIIKVDTLTTDQEYPHYILTRGLDDRLDLIRTDSMNLIRISSPPRGLPARRQQRAAARQGWRVGS